MVARHRKGGWTVTTLQEHARNLAKAHGDKPMTLGAMAQVFWPGADWLDRAPRNKGGAKAGARAAGALAGRLRNLDLIWICEGRPRQYVVSADFLRETGL
jgi:hypothetical protein